MKRSISERDQFENLTMANCLMFLSGGRSTATTSVSSDHHHFEYTSPPSSSTSSSPSRVFECKTCNRQFPSFQALGGHRASHKKPRLAGGPDGVGVGSDVSGGSPAKPQTHECNVCGLEFAIGQALGGHMRRHRAAMAENNNINNTHQVLHQYHHQYPFLMSNINNNINNLQAPVVKKISSSNNNSRRVLCLDLNLTPLENDIKILQLGKPLVNIF